MIFNVGDKVKTKQQISGLTKQSISSGAEGIVVRTSMGRADVCFTIPGVAGGTRKVEVSVAPDKIVKL
ncbi:hypothetical protein [Embleya sp. NBC_00896]|uniref:hypothetical protein n=1 Tax=Embleya sp. NBC_00896 TaxID=2975961 RepID=UPI00386FF729|nr:hypothetical protein OG928_04325 [Embleya sp. NBC_00896]